MRTDAEFDFTEAVKYHYGQFPPCRIDAEKLMGPLANASASLARYDQMLKGMHNSEILLAPLRSQEAVVSSRMEGTVSTLDEVLQYEAEQEDDGEHVGTRYRSEAAEVFLYGRAMKTAQKQLQEGAPLSSWLIRSAHSQLLGFGRGAKMSPGEYKTEQNYLADRINKKILFVPISPELLGAGMEHLLEFINSPGNQPLIQTAISHLEFEALHPFKDGNGRIGRMLITLMLWKYGVISDPHFYVSAHFEQNRDEYIDKMRDVSRDNLWTEWIVFFLEALDSQAKHNLHIAEEIRSLYEDMKEKFRRTLSSQWSTTALDFLFSRPVFKNNVFTGKSGIPSATAHRFARTLLDANMLKVVFPASGRRPALYAFEPLLEIVRSA